jgi:hypothetical protein
MIRIRGLKRLLLFNFNNFINFNSNSESMEIKISLDEYADIPFIKKLLSQIKGVTGIEVSENEKSYSWEEIENSDYFAKVMEQSENDYKNGKTQDLTDDVLKEIFNGK